MQFRQLVPLVLFLAFGAETYACGESLYRVGNGVAYREYTAPLPGNLLVYSAAGNIENLAAELGRAGHQVTVAKTMDDLVLLANREEFQVVIGPFHEYENVQSFSVVAEVNYLPIAIEGVDERAARAQFEHVMVPSKHEIRHYLKAIHKILKRA